MPAPAEPISPAAPPDIPLPSVRAPSRIAAVATPAPPPIAAPMAPFFICCESLFTFTSRISDRGTVSGLLFTVTVTASSVTLTIAPRTLPFLIRRISTCSREVSACTRRHSESNALPAEAWPRASGTISAQTSTRQQHARPAVRSFPMFSLFFCRSSVDMRSDVQLVFHARISVATRGRPL